MLTVDASPFRVGTPVSADEFQTSAPVGHRRAYAAGLASDGAVGDGATVSEDGQTVVEAQGHRSV